MSTVTGQAGGDPRVAHDDLPSRPAARPRILINDVVIEIATVNGSGSQSANNVLVRALFQMGIPVSAKNLFPSNIQGMPTWFQIRANKDGWTARRGEADIMVCMNGESVAEDVARLAPDSIVLVRDDLAGLIGREDLQAICVPFAKMVSEVCEIPKLRKLVVNIMYDGVLAHLLGIEMAEIERAIAQQFSGKSKAIEINTRAARAAHEWAVEHLEPLRQFRVERMKANDGKIMIDGNAAGALGAVWGGATVVAWYPITPSSSLAEALIDAMHELRRDPQSGKATCAVIQAEDELAAISIVIGAGWAGARAMTATSGPGISLMAEQAGLAYFAEVPAVIVDVQRMGPSTGLPTRTCQNDIAKAYQLSHGDCRHPLLIPGSVEECFELTCASFNLAERFQTLVFVMSDLDLGMNMWISDPFKPPTEPIARGKVLDAAGLERNGEFARYRDVDGDGVPYRTLPGTPHPRAAYFTRGTGHTDQATYSEKPGDWQANMDRLARKFESIRRALPPPVLHRVESRKSESRKSVGIMAYGSSDPAVREAVHRLDVDHGLPVDYLRVRALPAHEQVYQFIASHDRVYLVEQNRDAQMAGILKAERPDLGLKLCSVLHYDGMAIHAGTIVEQIMANEESPAAKHREP
jgi:2-oxoglutarate ferredoxin oxidoreductase subunit alpha